MIMQSHWTAARRWKVPYLKQFFKRYASTLRRYYTVTKTSEKHQVSGICEVCKILPDEGSAVSLNGETVVSVELLFLQLCFFLGDALPAILLGCLLCMRGPHGEPPLTSVSKLRAYALKASYICGRPRALYALTYIKDGFESPMEILTYMILCLPYRLGGHGFTDLNLVNTLIPISQAEAALLGLKHAFLRPDLCDLKHRIIVEYDGYLHHHTEADREYDELRRAILRSKGFTVIVLTKEDLFSFDKLTKLRDKLAWMYERRIRIRTPKFLPYFAFHRRQLPRAQGDSHKDFDTYVHSLKIRVRRL